MSGSRRNGSGRSTSWQLRGRMLRELLPAFEPGARLQSTSTCCGGKVCGAAARQNSDEERRSQQQLGVVPLWFLSGDVCRGWNLRGVLKANLETDRRAKQG